MRGETPSPRRPELRSYLGVPRCSGAVTPSGRLRTEVSEGAPAPLVPTRDDSGNRQGVVVHDAWWGALPLLPAHRPYRERGPAY